MSTSGSTASIFAFNICLTSLVCLSFEIVPCDHFLTNDLSRQQPRSCLLCDSHGFMLKGSEENVYLKKRLKRKSSSKKWFSYTNLIMRFDLICYLQLCLMTRRCSYNLKNCKCSVVAHNVPNAPLLLLDFRLYFAGDMFQILRTSLLCSIFIRDVNLGRGKKKIISSWQTFFLPFVFDQVPLTTHHVNIKCKWKNNPQSQGEDLKV